MNKTFKKIFSVCSAVVTTLTATLCHSTNPQTYVPKPKIVFAGPKASGKTKLVSGICNKYRYNSDYVATVFVNLAYTGQIQLWDTAGASMYIGVLPMYFGDTDLCVLHMSNTNQDIEDFLNILAETHVPKVVLCITKTDKSVPDSEKVRQLLGKIKQELPDVNVFDEVLYTSAQENTFRFCTPDECNTSEKYQIYDTEAKKTGISCQVIRTLRT